MTRSQTNIAMLSNTNPAVYTFPPFEIASGPSLQPNAINRSPGLQYSKCDFRLPSGNPSARMTDHLLHEQEPFV